MNELQVFIVVLIGTLIWYQQRARRARATRRNMHMIAAGLLPYDRAGRLIGLSANRVSSWWEEDAQVMREDQFRKHFRMRRSVFHMMVNLLNLPQPENGITRDKAVAICLFRLASGATVREISNLFAVAESTVHKYTKLVVQLIISRLGHLIQWPTTDQDRRRVAGTFLQYGQVYGVLGATDGSLIRMKNNPGDQSWFDRDGNCSMNLMAVCDGNMRFLHVMAGCQGSFNDKRVFRLSGIPQLLQQLPAGYFIVGDKGFTFTPKCMVPYRTTQINTRDRVRFNSWLSACRVKIEHAFSSLKSRWRILKDMDLKVSQAARVIVACCLLHNFLLDNNDEWPHNIPAPAVPSAPGPLPPSFLPGPRRFSQLRQDAHAVRESIVSQLRRALNRN